MSSLFSFGLRVLATGAALTAGAAQAAPGACCGGVELRQYTMVAPDGRDTLIALFEREFIESQEVLGTTVIGTFRDLDRPNYFVWLRGFADMERRREALTGFYSGALWQQHRNAANATIVDSDDVLLLRPAAAGSGFDLTGLARAPVGATAAPHGLVVATIYALTQEQAADFPAFWRRQVAPALAAGGIAPLASFETESAPNTYPRLPIREHEHVFVWFARYADAAAYDRAWKALQATPAWHAVATQLERHVAGAPQVLRLAPTPRSLLGQ